MRNKQRQGPAIRPHWKERGCERQIKIRIFPVHDAVFAHFDCELSHAWVTIKLRAQITNGTAPLSSPEHNLLVIALAPLRRHSRKITFLGFIITAIILPRDPDPGLAAVR